MMEQIKNNWIIIAFIASMIIWYADTNNRITTLEAQAEEDKTTLETITDSYTNIKTDLSSIKTDIGWIKNRLD